MLEPALVTWLLSGRIGSARSMRDGDDDDDDDDDGVGWRCTFVIISSRD